jgi:hypothetical protein
LEPGPSSKVSLRGDPDLKTLKTGFFLPWLKEIKNTKCGLLPWYQCTRCWFTQGFSNFWQPEYSLLYPRLHEYSHYRGRNPNNFFCLFLLQGMCMKPESLKIYSFITRVMASGSRPSCYSTSGNNLFIFPSIFE